jgi:microcystin degradation protein MlrC
MAQQVVVVKQGYLFPDLVDHAPRAIMALTPGASDLRLDRLDYRHIPRPVYPLDAPFTWEP